MPFPTLYNLYIGWVPVLLAMLCIVLARRNDLPVLFFLLSGILLMLFMASAIPLRWMINITPIFSGFRHTPLLAGLAVPALLGLAGYGLDRLLSLEWPQVNFHLRPNIPESSRKYSLAWLLIIPLILSGKAAYDFSQNWFTTYNNQSTYESLTSFETTSLQWIALPFGEHFWIEPALDKGLKITNVVWAWDWNDREPPKPKLEAYRGEAPVNTENVAVAGGVPVYLYADNEYTFVDLGDQIVPCTASGSGGDINVQCFTNDPGQLTVKENSWRGWIAWQDGERIPLLSNRWLSTEAPPGKHEYRFRYIPFDVIAGSILSLFGLVLTIWLWRRAAETNTNHEV
jgi:hypothetical protein